MPRKTRRGHAGTLQLELRFNEAAARCRGKPPGSIELDPAGVWLLQ